MLEVEVKLYLESETAARDVCRCLDLPWHAGEFEVNRVYDFPDARLARRGALVRIRERGGSGFLTYKEKSDQTVQDAKVRLEYETPVADPEAARKLLAGVGLEQRLAYERYRARHVHPGVHVEIDHLPGGWFCEIEGEPERIREVRGQAGLGTRLPIVWSYPEIFLALRERLGLTGTEWSFQEQERGRIHLPPSGDPFWAAAGVDS